MRGSADVLDYLSEQTLAPGTLVRVPLGRREVAGIVWQGVAKASADVPLRPIAQCLDCMPALPNQWLALLEFAAGYYQRGLGELSLAVLPAELRKLDASQLAQRLKRLHKQLRTTVESIDRAGRAPAQRRAVGRAGGDHAGQCRRARRGADAAARRDRQRQDRGLPARHEAVARRSRDRC